VLERENDEQKREQRNQQRTESETKRKERIQTGETKEDPDGRLSSTNRRESNRKQVLNGREKEMRKGGKEVEEKERMEMMSKEKKSVLECEQRPQQCVTVVRVRSPVLV